MTERENLILRNIDELSEKCISYLELNYSIIPNIGVFNVDLIVLSFLMDHLLTERNFKDRRMQKFLLFYENHFISTRGNMPRKGTVFTLNNDEIDSKNLIAYFNFEEMNDKEKRQFFIRTLSNISPDLDKFIESTKSFGETKKIHYPYLALINIYVDPLFCYKIPIDDYSQEINFLSFEIKNSDIDINKFLLSFSKMCFELIFKYLNDNTTLLDNIELNFPLNESEVKPIEKKQNISNNTQKNSGCMLIFSVIIFLSVFSFLLIN